MVSSATEVDVLHGQMKAGDKQRGDGAVRLGRTDGLVATSVIEVGIDVPDLPCEVMVIEEAVHWALAAPPAPRPGWPRQYESACILFADTKAETTTIRLETISSERDGFKLAEVDLSLRGEARSSTPGGLRAFPPCPAPGLGTLLRAKSSPCCAATARSTPPGSVR